MNDIVLIKSTPNYFSQNIRYTDNDVQINWVTTFAQDQDHTTAFLWQSLTIGIIYGGGIHFLHQNNRPV